MKTFDSLKKAASNAYWHTAMVAGLALSPQVLLAQNPQPGPQPVQKNDIERLIGDQGTIRSTGRLALDFGLWVATAVGFGLVIYGVYNGIKQSGEMEQQRKYGKAIMYTVGGAGLSGIRYIWEWIAQSVTGTAPTDLLLP